MDDNEWSEAFDYNHARYRILTTREGDRWTASVLFLPDHRIDRAESYGGALGGTETPEQAAEAAHVRARMLLDRTYGRD